MTIYSREQHSHEGSSGVGSTYLALSVCLCDCAWHPCCSSESAPLHYKYYYKHKILVKITNTCTIWILWGHGQKKWITLMLHITNCPPPYWGNSILFRIVMVTCLASPWHHLNCFVGIRVHGFQAWEWIWPARRRLPFCPVHLRHRVKSKTFFCALLWFFGSDCNSLSVFHVIKWKLSKFIHHSLKPQTTKFWEWGLYTGIKTHTSHFPHGGFKMRVN